MHKDLPVMLTTVEISMDSLIAHKHTIDKLFTKNITEKQSLNNSDKLI